MKKIFTSLTFFILCCVNSYAADTARVLFVGNSFTSVENVPQLVKSFADQQGLAFEKWMYAPGGITVGDAAQGNQAHMKNPQVYDLIRNNKIDYLVLQDNQGRFVLENDFPDTNASKVVRGHLMILDSMRHYHSCAKMIFFAGWALKYGWPDIGNGTKCIENIYENYLTLNGMANEIISPIGIAWLRAGTQLPGVDLWSPDEAHQSLAGAYITAATIFTSIYRINTEKVNFSSMLDTADARVLRRIAYQTVMDSVQPTGLAAVSPVLNYNGSSFSTATGFSKYEWYKNGTLVATTTTNTYIPAVAGNDCYQVVVTDVNGCKQRSLLNCQNVTTGIRDLQKGRLQITPNPASSTITLSTDVGYHGRYTIVDMVGHIVASGTMNDENTEVDIRSLSAGVYSANLYSKKGEHIHTSFVKTD